MKTTKILVLLTLLLTGFLLASCSDMPILNPGSGMTPGPEVTPTSPPTAVEPTEDPLPTQESVTTLILWLPEVFDPEGDTDAGELLGEQLAAFPEGRSGVALDVRIKSLEGPGSMLETVQTAGAAAPRVLPDLMLLPRELMEEAAALELIYPLEETDLVDQEDDWYPYALSLSAVGEASYGVPAAGDVLVLAHKSDLTEDPLADWEAVLEIGKTLTFPAADPRALVTLALYESDGGELTRVDESYSLDRVPMLNVLNFYEQAQTSAVMPYWLAQFETDSQAWEAYRERQATLALTWTSTYSQNGSLNTTLAPFPTRDGVPFTYGRGWVWVFPRQDADRRAEALALLEELSSPDFLAAWHARSGFLPVKSSELASWEGEIPRELLTKVLPSARLIPSRQTLAGLGPSIREAVLSVIKDEMTPDTVIEVLLLKLRDD